MSAEVRWLTATEMRLWRAFIEVCGGIPQLLDASLKGSTGLSFDDYEVLVHLSEAPERRLRMNELADALLFSRSRLSQRVDRLVGRDLVRRERCEDDGRGTFAVLTDAGWEALRAAAPSHVRDVRTHLLDHIAADQTDALADLFEYLAAEVRANR